MLTVENLKAWGANTEDGLRRCMNNEAFYLKLADKAARDPSFDRLKEALEAKDLDAAFDLAHALKGVTANLALTPVYRPVEQMTELLRGRTDTDYSPFLAEMEKQRSALLALMG